MNGNENEMNKGKTNMSTDTRSKKATPKQLDLLAKLGASLASSQSLTVKEASEKIESLLKQRKDEIQRLADSINIDLREYAARYSELQPVSANQMAGPCPKCGGCDRFNVLENWFLCRKCFPYDNGLNHSAIGFVMWVEGCTYEEAVLRLTNGVLPVDSIPAQPVKSEKPPAKEFNEEYYLPKVVDAHNALLMGTGKITQRAREYLTSRGFTIETIQAYKLGFYGINVAHGEDTKEPAISIPWFDKDGRLVAIKFRFIDDHFRTDNKGNEKLVRYTSRGSVAGRLFGWQTVKGPSRNNVLIITEGEFNDMALWQASKFDVLCTGSESNTIPEEAIKFAQQYSYRIVWADDASISGNALRRINADLSMSSIKDDGIKYDANKFLEIGELEPLLQGMLKKIGAGIPVNPQQQETAAPSVRVADEFEVIARRLPLDEALAMKERLNENTPGHRVAHDDDFPRGVHVFMVIKR